MSNILLGFQTVATPSVLLFLVIGCVVGLVIGALPGLTGNMAIALMVPMTFGMDPSVGLAFLAAIYCSSIFGGSISAILLGIPGTISSFATTLDGYPLAKKGKAGLALGTSTMASVFGGLFSAVVLLFLTPVLAEVALKFGPGEYFAISLLGIACITSISGDNIPKGLLSGMIGLLIAIIGMDPQNGYPRLTFGNINLLSGIGLVASLIGLFGVVSVFKTAEACKRAKTNAAMPEVDSVWIGWKECLHQLPTWIRGSIIGTVVGIIPGAGTNVATFMAYDMEKKLSKDPESFGQGNAIGVAAPESANNAVTGGFPGAPAGPGRSRQLHIRPVSGRDHDSRHEDRPCVLHRASGHYLRPVYFDYHCKHYHGASGNLCPALYEDHSLRSGRTAGRNHSGLLRDRRVCHCNQPL